MQKLYGFSISLFIFLDLLYPIISVMDRDTISSRTAVAMPKTAMHKDDLLQSWENYIRLTGKIIAMESKAKAKKVNH